MQPMKDPRQTSRGAFVRREVESLLGRTPSFQRLDAPTRQALTESMAKIAGFLADPEVAAGGPLAGQLAPPNLQQRLSPGGPGGGQPAQAAPAPSASPSGSAAPAPAGPSATARAGEVARATLNAIDFPSFVASLIQGTFQAIVNASIQQMEAYAELLKNVATTVDRFMDDNVSDGAARDHLADQYPGVVARDTSGGTPRLRVRSDQNAELPTFFKDLGFGSVADIDDEAVDQVIVPATRRQMAEQRQQTLATLVLMGLNQVVVDDGEIMAKLVFHIDASETTALNFTQFQTSSGGLSQAGKTPFSAQGIMVNTTNINAQSDINVRADLTGQVKVRFSSRTFPLEKFADPLAIQLINSNARVPPPALPPPTQPAQSQTPAAPPAPALPSPAFPAPQPAAPAPATPVSQGLAAAEIDPWAPEG